MQIAQNLEPEVEDELRIPQFGEPKTERQKSSRAIKNWNESDIQIFDIKNLRAPKQNSVHCRYNITQCSFNEKGFRKNQSRITEALPSLKIQKVRAASDLSGVMNKESVSNAQRYQNVDKNQKHDQNPYPTSFESLAKISNFSKKMPKSPKCLKKIQSAQTETPSQFYLPSHPSVQNVLFRPPSLMNNECEYIDRSELIFKIDQQSPEQHEQVTAYWKNRSCYVRVVKSQMSEEYCEQQQKHRGMVQIYGKLKIKFFQFFITQNFNGFTLNSMLEEYGPCSQRMIKKYVRTLIAGLSTIHSKGHAFNILTPSNIFMTIQGDILIDTVKGRSSGKLSYEQKKNNYYYLSPELLVNGENGFSNDTWSLGSIILAMIAGKSTHQKSQIHPYNLSEKEMEKQIAKNIKKYHKGNKKIDDLYKKVMSFKNQTKQLQSPRYFHGINRYRSVSKKYIIPRIVSKKPMELEISESLYNFVLECLKIGERSQVQSLLKHPFLFE